jgi:hypothetical protein
MSKSAGRSHRPHVTVTYARDQARPSPPARPSISAAHAAYGNGVVNTIVFTDPMVITARPPAVASGDVITLEPEIIAARPPGTAARFRPPPVPGGTDDAITFEPEVITARPPNATDTATPRAPKIASDTITFAPDKITASPPKPAPRFQPPPVPAAKEETITFEPEVIYGHAPPPAPKKPPPPAKSDTIVFAPDTIYGRLPPKGAAGKHPAPPARVNKDGVIEFEPDIIIGRAPGASVARGSGPRHDSALGALTPEQERPKSPTDLKEHGGEGATPKQVEPKAKDEEAAVEGEEEPAEKDQEAGKTISKKEKIAQGGLPKPAVLATEAATPAAAGGGPDRGAGADIAAWRAKVSRATAATPRPTLGNAPAASVTVITSAGRGASGKRKAAGGVLSEDARRAVRKPPETPKQLPPPPPTPVPAADQLVTDASDKKLPNQTLPELKRRAPDAAIPEMDTEFAADIGSKIDVPGAEPAPEAVPGDKKPLDAKQVKKLKDAKAKEPVPDKKAKPGQKLVLEDTAPPPTPGVEIGTKGQSKEKVAQVLAELLRSPDQEAEKIVTEARKEAYPRSALEMEYPSIGQEKKDEVLTELKNQVDSIRIIAGISAKDLDDAIKTREENLKQLESRAKDALVTAKDDSKKKTKESGEEMAEKIAGSRDAVDEHTIQTMIAATGEADPEVIKLRRDKGLRDLSRRATRQDVYYETSGERREKALDASHTRMRNAYKNAAKADRKKIYDTVFAEAKKAKETDAEARQDATIKSEADAKPFFEWAATQTLELSRQFAALKSEAATTIKSYRDGMRSALESAKELLRQWAEEKISQQESWWEHLIRMFREWMQDAQDDSAAWEEARNEALRDSLVGDLQMIDDIHAAAASGVDMNAHIQERGLDHAQAAVLQTYFGGDPKKPRDAVGAVAAGMRMRVRMARKPGIIEFLKSEVMRKPDEDWRQLGRIGNAEKPPFDVVALASDLHHAMDQWGTDEDKIYQALAGLTPVQARAIRAHYQLRYHRSLDEHLEDEMSDAELTRAQALLEGNQTLADVATLYEAMHGGLTGIGTDEDAIMLVLRNKTLEERTAIIAEYKKQYGIDLKADLKGELDDGWSSHHDFDRATALMQGDTAKADAIGLDQAMHGGITGAGTDEDAITRIYEQTRSEVEAEAARKGWSTAEMEAEVKRRNRAIEASYESKYGDPSKPNQQSALRKAFASELSGPELDLANALADNDVTAADAARLEVERQSFITSDDTVNKILESQYTRARKDVERDKNVDLQFRAEVDALQDKPWTTEKWAQEREKAKDEINKEAEQRSKLYMSKLENAYDEKYSAFGKGGLQALIVFNMSGDDRQKAFDLIKQGGHLRPEQEIFYAVNGIGTDVDALKRVLKGKRPEEIQAIRKAWKARYPDEPDLDSRIDEEVSGRDSQDMKWALQGEPQTMEEKLKRAKERMEYEKSAYLLGNAFSSEERAFMEQEYSALEDEKRRLDMMQDLKAPRKEGESEEEYNARLEKYAYWEESFNLQHGYFDRAVEDHRTAVDDLADTVANIAAIVATVVVIAVASFFTAGTGGAAIIAALASAKVAAAAAIAAAAATIASKKLLKGSAYGGQEIAVDAIVGVVDAAASYLTAGLGGGLLRTVRAGAPASRLATMAANTKVATRLAKAAASERAVTRIFANGLAEGIEGVASTLPSALVGNVVDEKNWAKGNPLTNILGGTLVQTGIGVGLSGGLGGLGGIGKHVDDVADALPTGRKALAGELAETGDILGKRGNPADRLAVWKSWSVENPGRPYKEFLQEFDAGIVAKETDDSARKALQREMRGELLSGIPPAQRGQFADVPIHVMSDADFQRFTRSSTGQAVVIFEDGKPRVILREGADPKALREEGIHLVQSKDPKFAKKFAELDETRLANWKNLDIEEQLRLYNTKLDIELDAQQRLIKSLDDQLATIDDPALRKTLQARREAALKNFENLKGRLDEVSGISPTERLKMARGELDPPQYLDQEPRLFSKRFDDAAKHSEFADILDRRAAAKQAKQAIVETLSATTNKKLVGRERTVIEKFEDIWQIYRGRADIFVKRAAKWVAGGRPISQLFDVTQGLKSLVDVVKEMTELKQLTRLDEMLTATERLLDAKGLHLKHIDPFVQLTPLFEQPGKLLKMVEDLASLTSFRKKALPDVADVVGKVARSGEEGPRLASEFADELTNLAAKAKARDAIGKATKNNAQDALDAAAAELKGKAARFGLVEKDVSTILEEFSRTGRFNFDVFKEKLTEKYPLSKETFEPLKDMLDELKKAAAVGKKEWFDTDIGPILHWRPLLQKLHGALSETGRDQLIKKLKDLLTEELPGLTITKYQKYRHLLKENAIDHVMGVTSPAAQFKRFEDFMKVVRERDPASIGEFFASFRRRIFARGETHAIQGQLAGAVDVHLASRQIEGSKRMVDGALEIAVQVDPPRGPRPGRYLVEDKAGKSFDLKQAINYSDKLRANALKTGDPEVADGLIYFVEDPKQAATIASALANNDLDARIFVTTFADGQLTFVARPAGPPPIKKGGKGRK